MSKNLQERDGSLTRRQAIGLVGASAGVAIAAGLGSSMLANAASKSKAKKPLQPVIRTLLKDIAPDELGNGSILFHEHLSLRYPVTRAMAEKQGIPVPANYSDDVDLMVEETRAAGKDGVSCIVDGGHPDMDRNIEALKRIAKESGVYIVGSGGYYMERNYPPEIATKSADEIADDLVREATEQHLGAFGEIGQQGGVLTDNEKKVFMAVAKAHVRTGLPIFTHNAYTGMRTTNPPVPRDAALRQLDALEAGGANPAHVVIGHVCCLDDPTAEIAIQLAKRGVFVGFDRVTIPIIPDAQKVVTIMAMAEAGYVDHILIASDFSNGRALKKNGGPGIAQAVTVFAPMLVKAGMSEETVHKIFTDNARRFLAFTPIAA
jgi:predicted metal-dependent phosphotriesterase family hydrolase